MHSGRSCFRNIHQCTLPVDDDLLRAVVRSPDSAPGLDGLPYAAYRAAPNAASRVLTHRPHDYVGLHAPAPVQALVFIPKADAGSYADNFRPLGLPNTADRIIDQAVYVQMYSALRGSLHPSQTSGSPGKFP